MALFGGKQDEADARGPSVEEVLGEACDRNTPVCVIRPCETGRQPMARGRLLALNEETIDIEELQVPGLKVEFHLQDDLDAYFSLGRTLYHFRTKLLRSAERKRLNQRMLIPGMTLTRPARLEQGDRRGLFRVSLSGLEDRFLAEVWKIRLEARPDLGIDEPDGVSESGTEGLPPIAFNLGDLDLSGIDADAHRPADYSGWLNDGTEHGFGIRLEFVSPLRFSIFEPLLVRVTLPGGLGVHRYLCEVRSKRPVADDGARLGVVVIPEADQVAARKKAAEMRGLLTEVQREQLRRSRKRTA